MTIDIGGMTMDETVMVRYYSMFDKGSGKSRPNRRVGPDGNPLGFDDIWQNILQLDADEGNGENVGRDIILARIKELEEVFPGHSPIEIKAYFRTVFFKLYQIFRQG